MAGGAFLSGFFSLAAVIVLIVFGKFFFGLANRKVGLREELVERDNLAVALDIGGYFMGLILAVGGTLAGGHGSLLADLFTIFLYGVIAVVLLNVSIRINQLLILDRFSMEKEIVGDRNCGVGLIAAANHVAMGLILLGIISGEGGGVPAVLVFWALGQVAMVAAGRVYSWMVPYGVQDALERGNVAVGAAFAGMLLAIGNIVRVGVQGSFTSWSHSLGSFTVVTLVGLVLLPLVRMATNLVILPGHRLTQELVGQENPNIGAGVLEGIMYVAASFLVGWCVG